MSFMCKVCQDDYMSLKNHGKVVWSKRCGHVFHSNCAISWMASCKQEGKPETCPRCPCPMKMQDLQVLFERQNPKELPVKRIQSFQHPTAELLMTSNRFLTCDKEMELGEGQSQSIQDQNQDQDDDQGHDQNLDVMELDSDDLEYCGPPNWKTPRCSHHHQP